MAVKTFYLKSDMSSNVHQTMRETAPGANAQTSPKYGWTPGATVIARYASADAQTMVPAGSFGVTAQPDGSIDTTQAAGDCWRSAVPLSGDFAAGTWTFQGSVTSDISVTGGRGKVRFRLFRSVSSDGSSAVELTSGPVIGNEVIPDVLQTDSIGTVSLGAITLANEYLFVQIGWEITVQATGMSASSFNVVLRTGNTASQVITTDFTQADGQTEVRESGNTTNVADVNTDWVSPSDASQTDGNVAQFINTPGFVGQMSDYLNADTFPFTGAELPDDAIITGIKAIADANADTASQISQISVRLVINGSMVGTDKATFAFLPTTMTILAWGGVGDTWSAGALTGADLKLTNSGFRIQVDGQGGAGGPRGRVDQMAMVVYFTRPASFGAPEQVVRRLKRKTGRRRFIAGDGDGATNPLVVVEIPKPTLWSIEGDRIVESYGYKTDVMIAYDGTEQRVKQRSVPEESIRFEFVGGSARESQLAASLAYGLQDETALVPLWQYASHVTSAVNAGAGLLPFSDAMLAPYVVGEFALLWQDCFTWEAVKVLATDGTGISVDGVVLGNWPVSTRVYPARRARMVDKVNVERNSARFLEGIVEFRMDRSGG